MKRNVTEELPDIAAQPLDFFLNGLCCPMISFNQSAN